MSEDKRDESSDPQQSMQEAKEPKEQPQAKEPIQPLQPTVVKTEDPSNKYSFSSYHMNIISGNKQVQTMQQPMYPNQQTDYPSYYVPPMFQQPGQFMPPDIQQVLNNMYMALSNQSKLLSYLVEKNESNIQTTSKIYQEMANLKEVGSEPRKDEKEVQETQSGRPHFKQSSPNSDITASDLVSILYGPKTQFHYKLIMDKDSPLDKTLYRQRNFRLKINLIDEAGKPFANSNKIPISLALYTVENPPKFLQSNTLGNKMLKGYTEQDLVGGTCTFDKIQIKEVTSHYRKGMLFMVAFAKMPSFGCVQEQHLGLYSDLVVDYTQIHPLVIDKVVVKAKKMKEEGQKQANGKVKGEGDSDKVVFGEEQEG